MELTIRSKTLSATDWVDIAQNILSSPANPGHLDELSSRLSITKNAAAHLLIRMGFPNTPLPGPRQRCETTWTALHNILFQTNSFTETARELGITKQAIHQRTPYRRLSLYASRRFNSGEWSIAGRYINNAFVADLESPSFQSGIAKLLWATPLIHVSGPYGTRVVSVDELELG